MNGQVKVFYDKAGVYNGFDVQIKSLRFNDYTNLSGVYTPIKLNDQFIYFLNNTNVKIFDMFPLLKCGQVLRKSMLPILFLYCRFKKLNEGQNVVTDELMNDAFKDTFDFLEQKYDKFNRSKFENYYLSWIVSKNVVKYNYKDTKSLIDESELIDDLTDVVKQLDGDLSLDKLIDVAKRLKYDNLVNKLLCVKIPINYLDFQCDQNILGATYN